MTDIYTQISDAIITLMRNSSVFADVTTYYKQSMTLEAATYPSIFVIRTDRKTTSEEFEDETTQDVLNYDVNIFYKSDHGLEDLLNAKDLELKSLILADPTIGGLVNSAYFSNSRIGSMQYLNTSQLLSFLLGKITVII